MFLYLVQAHPLVASGMMNFERINKDEVEQTPSTMGRDGIEPMSSGVLVEDANYPGRTSPLPGDFYPYLAPGGTYPG